MAAEERRLLQPLSLLGIPRRRLAAVGAAAAVAGMVEAAALLTVVHVAVAVSARSSRVPLRAGPLEVEVAVATAVAGAVALLGLRLLSGWRAARSVAETGAAVLERVRRDLLRSYLAAPWPVQASLPEGRLVELLSGHGTAVARGAAAVAAGLGSAATFLTLILAAVVVAPLVSLVVLAVVSTLVVALRPWARSTRAAARRLVDANLALAGAAAELSTMSAEVAAFGVAGPVGRRLDADVAESARRFRELAFARRFLPTVLQTAALAVVVAGLVLLVAADRLDVAAAGASVAIAIRALSAAQPVQNSLQVLRELGPFLDELQGEHARLAAGPPGTGTAAVSSVGELRLEGVGVTFGDERPGLAGIDLVVSPGEVVGVTGPSGSGKTTLLEVLVRLREPDTGTYLVDGRRAADLDLHQWSRRVGFVPQDSRLLDQTVLEAVRFHRAHVDDDAVRAAARLAHVDEDVLGWPDGYATLLGPRGAALSGGQRQRLSLARALAAGPDLLVLDEPTSALDGRSEALVRDTLSRLAGRTTVVIVAHRPSTLQLCDRIVVLEGGRITASERPDSLAAASPFYRDALAHARGERH